MLRRWHNFLYSGMPSFVHKNVIFNAPTSAEFLNVFTFLACVKHLFIKNTLHKPFFTYLFQIAIHSHCNLQKRFMTTFIFFSRHFLIFKRHICLDTNLSLDVLQHLQNQQKLSTDEWYALFPLLNSVQNNKTGIFVLKFFFCSFQFFFNFYSVQV